MNGPVQGGSFQLVTEGTSALGAERDKWQVAGSLCLEQAAWAMAADDGHPPSAVEGC